MTGRDVKTSERVLCGAFAGLVAQTITYPIEVTRRRMQAVGLSGDSTAVGVLDNDGNSSKKTKTAAAPTRIKSIPAASATMMSTMRDLYQEQGIRGFFKGVSMNWLKGPVSFGISFTVFDSLQQLFKSGQDRQHSSSKR